MIEKLKTLHADYCRLSGQDIKYQPCERMLFDFINTGFEADDLRCVLTFLLHHNRKREPKFRERILFHRIIGDLETFNSRLGEARAWERNRRPAPTEKEKTVAAFRGATPEAKTGDTSKSFRKVFENIYESCQSSSNPH